MPSGVNQGGVGTQTGGLRSTSTSGGVGSNVGGATARSNTQAASGGKMGANSTQSGGVGKSSGGGNAPGPARSGSTLGGRAGTGPGTGSPGVGSSRGGGNAPGPSRAGSTLGGRPGTGPGTGYGGGGGNAPSGRVGGGNAPSMGISSGKMQSSRSPIGTGTRLGGDVRQNALAASMRQGTGYRGPMAGSTPRQGGGMISGNPFGTGPRGPVAGGMPRQGTGTITGNPFGSPPNNIGRVQRVNGNLTGQFGPQAGLSAGGIPAGFKLNKPMTGSLPRGKFGLPDLPTHPDFGWPDNTYQGFPTVRPGVEPGVLSPFAPESTLRSRSINPNMGFFDPEIQQRLTDRPQAVNLTTGAPATNPTYPGPKGIPQVGLNKASRYAAARKMGSNLPSVQATDSEIDSLARMMVAESGSIRNKFGAPNTLAMQAVADTVRNRMLSGQYPGDVTGVLNQPRQFSPMDDGRFNTITTSHPDFAGARAVAESVLSGESPPVSTGLHFGNLNTIYGPKSPSSKATKAAFRDLQKDPNAVTFADARNPSIQHTFGTIGPPRQIAGMPGATAKPTQTASLTPAPTFTSPERSPSLPMPFGPKPPSIANPPTPRAKPTPPALNVPRLTAEEERRALMASVTPRQAPNRPLNVPSLSEADANRALMASVTPTPKPGRQIQAPYENNKAPTRGSVPVASTGRPMVSTSSIDRTQEQLAQQRQRVTDAFRTLQEARGGPMVGGGTEPSPSAAPPSTARTMPQWGGSYTRPEFSGLGGFPTASTTTTPRQDFGIQPLGPGFMPTSIADRPAPPLRSVASPNFRPTSIFDPSEPAYPDVARPSRPMLGVGPLPPMVTRGLKQNQDRLPSQDLADAAGDWTGVLNDFEWGQGTPTGIQDFNPNFMNEPTQVEGAPPLPSLDDILGPRPQALPKAVAPPASLLYGEPPVDDYRRGQPFFEPGPIINQMRARPPATETVPNNTMPGTQVTDVDRVKSLEPGALLDDPVDDLERRYTETTESPFFKGIQQRTKEAYGTPTVYKSNTKGPNLVLAGPKQRMNMGGWPGGPHLGGGGRDEIIARQLARMASAPPPATDPAADQNPLWWYWLEMMMQNPNEAFA